MHKLLTSRPAQVVGGAVSGLAAFATVAVGQAMATGIEYSTIATAAKTEAESAINAILPFVAFILGVLVGIAVIRRLAKAR